MQAFALLVAGGYAHPTLPSGADPAALARGAAANLGLVRTPGFGPGMGALAAPALGSAIAADQIEALAVADRLAGHARSQPELATHIMAALTAGGGVVRKDGKPVADPEEAHGVVMKALDDFGGGRTRALERLGILPQPEQG
jgi:hypothetical protein